MKKSERGRFIGASLGCFRHLDLTEAIRLYLKLAGEYGLNSVEIRFEKEAGKPSLWAGEAGGEVADFLQNFELSGVHLPFVYLNPISPDRMIRNTSMESLKNAISRAGELGAGYTVMHARGFAHGLSREQEKRAWQEVIRELAEYAGGHSMLLAVENADALSDLKELANLVREIDSEWLRITLDIGHAFIRKVPPLSGYPVKELVLRSLDTCLSFSTSSSNMPYHEYGSVAGFIRAESDLIAVVHIHDNNGRQDHLLTGDGKIDFSFMKELKERFKGTYIFESNFVNHEVDFRRNYEKFRGLMSL